MDNLLQQGVDAYKAGKLEEARKIFITVVKRSPDSEAAWGWMYQTSSNDRERIHCLKQILRLNPNSKKAKELLDSLTGSEFPFELSQNVIPPLQTQANNPAPVASNVSAQKNTTMSNPVKPNSSYVTNIVAFVLVGIFGTCVLIFILGSISGGGSGGGASSRNVRYIVTGSTNTSSVNYTNATNGDDSVDVYLPFQKDITLQSAGFVSILAWPGGNELTGTISCEVWVNGKLEEKATANNTLVTCGAYVP